MTRYNTKELVRDVIENIKNSTRIKIETGYADLDRTIGGLEPGKVYIIGGRPSMGKTNLMLNMINKLFLVQDKKGIFFSMKLPKEEVIMRLLAINGWIEATKIRMGNLTKDEWDKVIESASGIGNSNLFIDDSLYGFDIDELVNICKGENYLDIIFVDYLQLLHARSFYDNRQEETAYIIRKLKEMAKELNVPIIVTSQVSRAAEKRSNHRPLLSDLKESSVIEEIADGVIFLYRDECYNIDTSMMGIAEIIVAKNSAGPLRTIELCYAGEYLSFMSVKRLC